MTKEQQLRLLRELLDTLKHLEEIEPHFTNRRRIAQLEEQIKTFQ